uniref:Uncharacterized protein n=1 Tax=Rhizophora mucronata TaxID=61149 RepID=A0A2P2QVH8_RHIMU
MIVWTIIPYSSLSSIFYYFLVK